MLISVCYLVIKGLLQTQSDGTVKMMDFFDEQRMSRLYEKFILEYYRKEWKQITAYAAQIPWQLDDDNDYLLPIMQTDITLVHGCKTLIIDAKYYGQSLQGQYDSKSVISGNLYQIFTYVKNKEAQLAGKEHEVAGMLLYARTDEELVPDNTYTGTAVTEFLYCLTVMLNYAAGNVDGASKLLAKHYGELSIETRSLLFIQIPLTRCILECSDYNLAVKRISLYMGDPHMYITWEKANLYKGDYSAEVSEGFQQILGAVDLMDKYLLPFRYWGHNDFREFDGFVDAPKQLITELNNDLNNNYKCLRNHYDCRNSDYFKEYLLKKYNLEGITSLNNKSFAASYEEATKAIFEFFNEELYDNNRKLDSDFPNSKLRKLIDIATNYFMGSIMSNYYKKDFNCYDGEDSWGFEIYDPLPYNDSEEINITSPLPVFNNLIEQIEFELYDRIELPEDKDDQWHNDSLITEKNLLNLLKPIIIKKEEWVLLSGVFSPHEQVQTSIDWQDTYIIYCCSSKERHINGKEDRYLTIEIPEYTGNLRYYYLCEERPELCKDIRSISTTDEFDDSTLVLPPADMIRFFKLTPNYRDMSWSDQNGNTIILCDNCKKSYYRDPVKGIVLMKKEAFDEYLTHGVIKYFAFTERLIKDKGFSNESCFHYELQDGTITRKFRNDLENVDEDELEKADEECINCPYNLYEKKIGHRAETKQYHDELFKMLKKYVPSDWSK